MPQPLTKPATYDDLLAVPQNKVAEILNGRLVTHPRPAPGHALASSNLGSKINPPFHHGDNGGPGGWWIIDEPELHLGAHVLVPDLAGWRRERLPSMPETAWFETVPDWICEVLSPSTEKYDRHEKRDIYASFGVKWLWLVNPQTKVLEGFELQGEKWLLLATLSGQGEVALAPFSESPFMLETLWN